MAKYDEIITRTNVSSLIPVETSNEIIREVPQNSFVMRYATKLRNMAAKESVLQVNTALPYAYFVNGDTGLKQTTSMEWEGVKVTAEEIAAIVPISESVLDDAAVPIWDQVRPALITAIGKVIDEAVIYGIGKPASWPAAIWDEAVAKGHTVDISANGGDLYATLLEAGGLYSMVEEDGYAVNGLISHLSMRAKLRGVRTDLGQPIFIEDMRSAVNYSLLGVPMEFPDNGIMSDPTKLMIAGAWSKLVYSIRQDITWKFLDQSVISDADGKIIFNLAQQDMVALRVTMRLGFAVPNPVSYIKPREERYPFAVLTANGTSSK